MSQDPSGYAVFQDGDEWVLTDLSADHEPLGRFATREAAIDSVAPPQDEMQSSDPATE